MHPVWRGTLLSGVCIIIHRVHHNVFGILFMIAAADVTFKVASPPLFVVRWKEAMRHATMIPNPLCFSSLSQVGVQWLIAFFAVTTIVSGFVFMV